MAAARNTTGETDIRRKLDEYVDAHLTRHMYDTDESWPLRKTIRLPKQAELEQHYNQIRAQNETIRDWARQHHCETSEKTKIVSSGLIQQKSPLIDSVTIPDLDTALRIATKQTRERYLREHDRMSALAKEFGLEPANAMNVAKTLKDHDDTDFHLVIQAAHYFANHDCHTMTPRMAPIPGFSAKWLGTPNSQRRKAICQLTGQDNLTFQERPNELRLRLMDAEHHDQPDLIVTQPWVRNQPTDIEHAIIIENKDTYQAMPTVEHAICILGNGYAATSHITTLLPWLTTIPNIIYWGRHGRQRTRHPLQTTRHRHPMHIHTDGHHRIPDIRTIRHPTRRQKQTPQPTPGLTTEERKLYETLCTGTDIQYLRIEQERIPIRDATTILHDQHHWPIDIPGNDIPNNTK